MSLIDTSTLEKQGNKSVIILIIQKRAHVHETVHKHTPVVC